MFLVLGLLFCLSLSRSAVSQLDLTDSKRFHKNKDRRFQRLYTFYQKKDKVKASISACEILLSFVFVFCALALVKSDCNVFNSAAVIDFSGGRIFEYITIFIVIAFVLVGIIEIPSRVYSEAGKEKFLMRTSRMTSIVYTVMSPFVFVGAYSKEQSEEDNGRISDVLNSGQSVIGEKEMLRNILQFGDTQVKEIMTPRHNIVAVEKDEKFSALKKLITASNFSRIPVFERTPDNIFGIIYVKDLLKYISQDDSFEWGRLVRKISYVSENKKISDLLKVFRQKKIHMAAVSDEYGGISGLITMQDILEEIVGEINDEFDENDEVMFKKISEDSYVFDGRIMLSDFYRTLSLEDGFFDGVKGDAESLAGVLLEMRGEFPDLGEKISYKHLTFTVEAFNNRRIEKIGVKISNNQAEK
jgi:CBS domain containing-hemolysin-like protein